MNSNIDRSNIERKSAAQLKQEVLQDIRKLGQDVDQLKDHLTPGQIIDDALFYRQERTPRATFDYLKANPVGTSFLAIGTLLLMEDQQNRSFESIARTQASGVIDSARTSYQGVRSSVEGRVESVKGAAASVKQKVQNVKGRFKKGEPGYEESGFATGDLSTSINGGPEAGMYGSSEAEGSEFGRTMDSLKGNVSDMKESIQAKIPDVKAGASQMVDEAKGRWSTTKDSVRESVSSAVGSVKESFQGGVERARNLDPLTYAILGAGLGTLTGASLPLFEREKAFVDSTLDTRLSQFTQDLEAALNESANILKNEFFGDISRLDLNIFGRGGQATQTASAAPSTPPTDLPSDLPNANL